MKLDLQKFALAKETFVAGDTATGNQAFEYSINFSGSDFTKVCAISGSRNMNESVETVYESCKNGISSTYKTGFDPEWSFEILLKKGTTEISEILLKKELGRELGKVKLREDNLLNDLRLEVDVCVTVGEINTLSQDLVKVQFTAKPVGALGELVPIPASKATTK